MISPFLKAREKRFPVWAPTSNLVLRRDRSRFDETLPSQEVARRCRTLCSILSGEKRTTLFGFRSRCCRVTILWKPSATMRRAFRWGASSVDLQTRHEDLSLRTYPDTIETIVVFWLLIWILVSIFCTASIALSRWWFAFAIAIVLTAIHDTIIWVTRIMSHIRFNQYSLISGAENGVRSTHSIQAAELIQVARSDGGVFYLCLVGVAILATIIDSTFLLGRLYGIFTKRHGWKCVARNFDFTFGTEDRLPACLAFKDVAFRLCVIPTRGASRVVYTILL